MPDEGKARAHVDDENLDLYVAGRLADAESSQVEKHVGECNACGQRLARAVEFMLRVAAQGRSASRVALADRRCEPRTVTDDPGSMRVLHPGVGAWAGVQVLDASKGGTRVRTAEYLAPGTLVQLRIKDTIVLGETRYCVRAEDGFHHSGIQIQDMQ